MSQKYTIVHFFDEQPKDFNFSAEEWPVHTTLLDMFTASGHLADVQNELQKTAATTRSFYTKAISETKLGINKDVAVTLLSKCPEIIKLHIKLVGIAEKTSLQFDHPEFVEDGFVPHASIQGDSRLELGTTYRIGNISLVNMYPNNDINRRAVLNTYEFL